MTEQEAADLVAVLRTTYPAGEAAPELTMGYAKLLMAYDHEAAQAGVTSLWHSYQSRYFPAWAVIEQAIVEQSPAYGAWRLVTAALDARSISPPDWPDAASRAAAKAMGGWPTFSGWDGSRDALRDAFIRSYDDAVSKVTGQDRPRLGEGQKAVNVSGDDTCGYCHDTGLVDLTGTVTYRGVVYPSGVTACRWCERGEILYRAAATRVKEQWRRRPMNLISDYTTADLADPPVERSGERLSVEEYAESEQGRADPALKDERVRDMLGLGR
jgi:hypothetical protein